MNGQTKKRSLLKRWETLVGLLVGVIAVAGGFYKGAARVDSRYSKTVDCERTRGDLKLTQMRLDQKILYDRLEQYEERIKRKEDRNGCHSVQDCETRMDDGTREEYRKLRRDRDLVRDQYDRISVE